MVDCFLYYLNMFFFERERYYFNSSFLPLLEPLLSCKKLYMFCYELKACLVNIYIYMLRFTRSRYKYI